MDQSHMSISEARMIKHIKMGFCTYRRLAEIYYPEDHDLYGMQWAGEDLCREACKVLGFDWCNPNPTDDPEFEKQNQLSFEGGKPFYWFY